MPTDNPFLTPSSRPFQLPPFDQIEDHHFRPAFEQGMAEHKAEVLSIAKQDAAPTVDNTLAAMERAGRLLDRVSAVFFNLVSADANDARQAIRQEVVPQLAAHRDELMLNADLFGRVQALHEHRHDLDLDPETLRLVEETYKRFVRAGAELDDADKETLKAINTELASLQTQFRQNVLKEVNDAAVVVDDVDELDGLSDAEIAAAKNAATERGLDGQYVLPLLNTSRQPVVASLTNRALRARIQEASLTRGSRGGDYDNRALLARIARLRAERAQLLGFAHHAAYSLESQMAETAEAVNERLATLAPLAVANAKREAEALQALIDEEGGDFVLQAHDWLFYAEKLRTRQFDFDAAQLKPYLELDHVLERGVFHAAHALYGLSFAERHDIPLYHPDARVWEVTDADGAPLGLFIGDFYARPSKQGGAWMSSYVRQSHLLKSPPVIANHLNVAKPAEGDPTLLTWDEVITLFHEFGHALHGFFSDVTYPSFSGTSVPRDFVEFPSQVNEMWALWPSVLAHYAVHYETGEPMPEELLEKVRAMRTFNQGYDTTEYLAASLLDQAWHQLGPDEVPEADDVLTFEARVLDEAGVALPMVPPRYRSPYFSHIIGGYAAGYYAYIWAEVLDADAGEWFKAHGGLTRTNGDRFRAGVLSRGGATDAMTLFTDFRGAEPDIQPLLERRGLTATPA